MTPGDLSPRGRNGRHLSFFILRCGSARATAATTLLDSVGGSSVARDTEHGRAITAQLTRRHRTLERQSTRQSLRSHRGIVQGIRRQARAACEDYFYSRLHLTPSHELGGPGETVDSLEPMPEPMYRALEHVVDLVVDGEYEELRASSGNRLTVEDLRRRIEDDCPESLVLASREVYRSRRSPSPMIRTCRAGLTSWTCGPRPAGALHIEASSRSPASDSRRR